MMIMVTLTKIHNERNDKNDDQSDNVNKNDNDDDNDNDNDDTDTRSVVMSTLNIDEKRARQG